MLPYAGRKPKSGPALRTFPESSSAMNKRQLIDDIRRYNSNAHPRFLAQFDEAALRQYLEHLECARLKRTRTFGSIRRDAKLRLVS